MTAPAGLLAAILGGRAKPPHHPNVCDADSPQSVAIADRILDLLGLRDDPTGPRGRRLAPVEGQAAGAVLEREVRSALESYLAAAAPTRAWQVNQPGLPLSRFAQYAHLQDLQRLIEDDLTRTLAVAIGRDYEVKPDVTVGETVRHHALPLLHASVSCKLTLRSDRAQNVRLEAAILTRHRHGRQPHIVAVTAEPLPTRLASLARGTGDLDALYHVALPELIDAVADVGNQRQADALDEMVKQKRLLPYSTLGADLAV